MGYFAGSISGNDPESTKRKKKTYLYFGLLVIFIEIMTCAYVRYKLYRKRRQQTYYYEADLTTPRVRIQSVDSKSAQSDWSQEPNADGVKD
jgi:hypothetical protein